MVDTHIATPTVDWVQADSQSLRLPNRTVACVLPRGIQFRYRPAMLRAANAHARAVAGIAAPFVTTVSWASVDVHVAVAEHVFIFFQVPFPSHIPGPLQAHRRQSPHSRSRLHTRNTANTLRNSCSSRSRR